MTARQDELQVHELALSGPELEEESFLKEGTGSHFESRVSELVVLRPTTAGANHLAAKVDQLVARGFHNLIVSLRDCDGVDVSAPLSDSRGVLDTWAGTLRIVDAPAGFSGEGLEVFASVSAAVDAYRASLDAPLDPGESGDLLQSTSQEASEDLNDWGWGTDAAREAQAASGPAVPIAELLVEDSELPKLDKDLRKVLLGGKKHVSLRLHFTRPMREGDVTILTRCRDLLAGEGGQLALVALPQDALKWLKLLDLHREFLLCESPDEAEEAHQRHARGEAPQPAAPAADEPFSVISHDGNAFVIRPRATRAQASVRRTNREVPLLRPGSDLSGVPERARGLGYGAVIDLSKLRDAAQSKALEPLAAAAALAREHGLVLACASVSHEVRALLPTLGAGLPCGKDLAGGALAFAEAVHAKEGFEELRLVLQPETLAPAPQVSETTIEPISSVEFDSGITLDSGISLGDVMPSGGASSAELDELRVQAAKAQGEAAQLREQLGGVQAQLQQALGARDQAQQTLSELQESLRRQERRVNELEQGQLIAEKRAQDAESSQQQARGDTERLSGEVARLRQELDEAQQALSSAQEALSSAQGSADAGARVSELESELSAMSQKVAELKQERDEIDASRREIRQLAEEREAALEREAQGKIKRLEAELAAAQQTGAAVGGPVGTPEALQQRVGKLEQEKAKILTEAETEIERLTREQQLLREELESAGEMIERLGKELELS